MSLSKRMKKWYTAFKFPYSVIKTHAQLQNKYLTFISTSEVLLCKVYDTNFNLYIKPEFLMKIKSPCFWHLTFKYKILTKLMSYSCLHTTNLPEHRLHFWTQDKITIVHVFDTKMRQLQTSHKPVSNPNEHFTKSRQVPWG